MKKQIEFIIFQFFRFIILLMPLKSAQVLGKTLGQISYCVLTKRRAITLENLKNAFPEKSDTELKIIIKGVFQNLAISVCEFLWFPNLTDETLRKLVKYNNLDIMTGRHKLGRGMIMLSGHFANWELIAFATAYTTEIPFTIIVKTQTNKKVDRVINRHRTKYGNRVVAMEQSVREILSALTNGGIVAMAADQSAPKESVFVEFFGRAVATFQGPAVFALRSGAPLQMGILIRQPDFTYEAIIEEIDYSDLKEYNEQNIIELTQRHTALLEKYIRRYPELWMWTHRRWKNIK
jgi:KDO2-lipid IV(A) lauroyltransferase